MEKKKKELRDSSKFVIKSCLKSPETLSLNLAQNRLQPCTFFEEKLFV